jgi:hypothetical protein
MQIYMGQWEGFLMGMSVGIFVVRLVDLFFGDKTLNKDYPYRDGMKP